MRARRRFFTLFEMMIATAVLSIVAVVVGVNVRQALKEQRFMSEVQQVVSQLQLAQDLMLILKSDATLIYTKDAEGIHPHFSVEKIISKQWLENLHRNRKPLKAIKEMTFDDYPLTDSLPIKLAFHSAGSVMSRGELIIQGDEEKYYRKICLHGYPRPINSSKEDEVLQEPYKKQDSMRLYPKDIQDELKAKV